MPRPARVPASYFTKATFIPIDGLDSIAIYYASSTGIHKICDNHPKADGAGDYLVEVSLTPRRLTLNMCKIQAPDRYRQSAFIQFDPNGEQEPNPSSGAEENDQRPVHVLGIWYGHEPLSRSPNIGVVLAFDRLTREMV
ncbi:uncharacterized protein CIMG_04745 [Coccidioides immitis RS]|uniref:Uncharacterized protein n=3 Tax=Coccidioides immitis TaxID=5501 RepID=J3KE52_COCIM|nr:uncharacterized protein CIMG_04745 [Coccidioides immitis RS]EAS33721.3 hypothetical protein CIMG_04745 [Coccidioides immitis RS]KMP04911.1 hypothetical protein CIRG_04592 [Coccidioides immitis RMSCC 2394]KMU78107.1 hypothetical protein CISG_06948 [Coccidioides immitis RMSCC 3703]TPX21374.1 hypothetical protein DIZ76_015331 [Coccidioides immitis]